MADQRAYAPSARRAAKMAGKDGRGVYETSVNRRLLSASTRVVSALIPALELYPNGNDNAATIRCVREAVHDPDPVIARGFEPTANNYRYFALTSRGVAVGFRMEWEPGSRS